MNGKDYNKQTGLKQDPSYNSDFQSKNFKSLKYYTESFNDPAINLDKLLVVQNQFANVDNNLRYSSVVSDRQKTIYPPTGLATTPFLGRGSHNVDIENAMRSDMSRDRKVCNPKDDHLYKRTFYIFEGMPIVYNTERTPMTQKDHSHRGGIDTHQINYEYK